MKTCDHRNKIDLSQGLGPDRHYYCPVCKCHWYAGRFWTRAEWDEYVNEVKDEYMFLWNRDFDRLSFRREFFFKRCLQYAYNLILRMNK